MSNESSASETTPLRRPESQLSANSGTNVATNNYHVDRSSLNTGQTALDIPSNNDTNSNLNNSRIEERLHNDNNNRTQQPLQQQQTQQLRKDMETNKRILCRVGIDIVILLCGKCCTFQLAVVVLISLYI